MILRNYARENFKNNKEKQNNKNTKKIKQTKRQYNSKIMLIEIKDKLSHKSEES